MAYFPLSKKYQKVVKSGNNPVGKKVNTQKVNTGVFTFLRKYPGFYG